MRKRAPAFVWIWQTVGPIACQWRYLAVIGLAQLLPPFASSGYPLTISAWAAVNTAVLLHPIKAHFASLFPIFQIIPLLLLLLIFSRVRVAPRIFMAYGALSYVLIAFAQNLSVDGRYGLAVCTATGVTFLFLAGLWGMEAASPGREFVAPQKALREYWPFLLALIPFWEPLNPRTLTPDFNPMYLLTSGAGLSFCMLTPLYLAILSMGLPNVNRPFFVATAATGLILGLGNLLLEFGLVPGYGWVGGLHIPLVILSIYSLWLAARTVLKNDTAGAAYGNTVHGLTKPPR